MWKKIKESERNKTSVGGMGGIILNGASGRALFLNRGTYILVTCGSVKRRK
jgi:outer membrane lipoprotein SlyB